MAKLRVPLAGRLQSRLARRPCAFEFTLLGTCEYNDLARGLLVPQFAPSYDHLTLMTSRWRKSEAAGEAEGLPINLIWQIVPTGMYAAEMDTRERLVESMRELLWDRGYVGTSPKTILRRAGAGQGSMYHHFAGKADLAHAAIERTAQEMRALAEAELAIPGTAVERITRYLRRERDVLRGCPIGGLTQDPEVLASPALRAPVEQTLTWLRVRLAEVLAEGRRHGELNAVVDPLATAATIVAVLQGGYVLARAAGTTDPFDQAIDGILALLGANAVSGRHRVRETGR